MSATRFGSLAELSAAHADLVRSVGRELLDGANLKRVAEFVRRSVATGAVLEPKEDRAAAQEMIGFWTARVTTAAREQARATRKSATFGGPTGTADLPDFGDTLLAEYDKAGLKAACATASQVLEGSPDLIPLARRLFLRLVWLRPDGKAFDPVPTTRSGLHDLAAADEVDRLIDRFAAAGVLRVTPGATPATDQVALRSAALLTLWPALRDWMDGRQVKRRRAETWADPTYTPSAGRRVLNRLWGAIAWGGKATDWVWGRTGGRWAGLWANDTLLSGDDLNDARTYHDRTEVERRHLDASLATEQQTNDRNRFLMGLFGLMATLAAVGWVVGVTQARRANKEADVAEQKACEAQVETGRANAEAERAKASAREATEKELDRAARERLSGLRLLVRAQARVATARTPAERSLALFAWDQLLPRLPREFFLTDDEIAQLRENAEAIQEEGGLCQSPDLSVADIHRLRDRVAQRPDTQQTLKGVRAMSFALVRQSAGKIAAEFRKEQPSFTDVSPYIDEFWSQYWGEMLLVERKPVTDAMVAFGRVLNEVRDHAARPDSPKKDRPPPALSPSKDGPMSAPRPGALSREANELAERAKRLSLDELDRLARKIRERPVPQPLRDKLQAAAADLMKALDAEANGPLPGRATAD